MSRTASPPKPDGSADGGMVDYRNVQRVVGRLRAGDRMSVPRAGLILAGGMLAIVAVTVLIAVAVGAGSGWTDIARGPGDTWDAAVREDADGTAFRLRGTGFFDRTTVVLADPAPGDSVRAAVRTVGDHTVVVGVAAVHVTEVRVVGGETAPEDAQPTMVDLPLSPRVFAVGLHPDAVPGDIVVEGLDRTGESIGGWSPALPDDPEGGG